VFKLVVLLAVWQNVRNNFRTWQRDFSPAWRCDDDEFKQRRLSIVCIEEFSPAVNA
jgi:hypothetical protein